MRTGFSFDVVNVLVLVAFAVDYAVELILASQRGIYVRKEWTSAAIVISQAISLLPGLAGFGVLRAFRAARLFRVVAVVLRLLAVGGAAATEGRAILRKKAARFALGLAAFTWLMSAVAFTLAENVSETGTLNSFGDALWWSAATITTVGYGDIYPVTALGRVVGVFTMLVGISTFAVVTAKVAEFLVRADMDDRRTGGWRIATVNPSVGLGRFGLPAPTTAVGQRTLIAVQLWIGPRKRDLALRSAVCVA